MTAGRRPNRRAATATGALWEATAPAAPELSEPPGPARCDVAIVGAGFTGLCAALALAEAGTDTLVLDARDVGWGASGRNGGQVNPLLPVKDPDALRRTVGPVYFERLAEVSLGSADALFDLIRRYQIACEARQCGWLRVDHTPAARAPARQAAKAWNAVGAGFEFVDGTDVRNRTGSPWFSSAILAPRGGAVQPLALARGLARAARGAGARIFRDAAVTRADRRDGRWHLTAGGQPVEAGAVILATNGYTDGVFPRLRRSVLPLTPIQIATEPLAPERAEAVLPGGTTIADTRRLTMYARREPGGQIVFGGIGYPRPGGFGGFRWLVSDAARIFPSLKGVAWRYRWGGRIALTADRIPHLHEPAPGVVAGLGYNGRGVAMAAAMGAVLARRTLGTPAEDLPFPAAPITPFPFREVQTAGMAAALHWMRLRDNQEFRRLSPTGA